MKHAQRLTRKRRTRRRPPRYMDGMGRGSGQHGGGFGREAAPRRPAAQPEFQEDQTTQLRFIALEPLDEAAQASFRTGSGKGLWWHTATLTDPRRPRQYSGLIQLGCEPGRVAAGDQDTAVEQDRDRVAGARRPHRAGLDEPSSSRIE